MKLLVLHGPAINSSRQKLIQLKQKFDPQDVVVFEKEAKIEDVKAALMTESLFSNERLIILENPSEDFINYTLYPNPYTLILWFDHEVDATKFKDAQVYFFPETKEISVFPFLDFLGNKDNKAFLESDKLKKIGFESQYLITMILYLLRNLVVTPKGAKDFVKNKNAKMRKNFSPEQLVNLYKSVLDLDLRLKSGLLENEQAQFLLVNLFLY